MSWIQHAVYLNPIEQSRTPEHWAADVIEHLLGGRDVTISPVRGRDAFLQIPGRYHFRLPSSYQE